MFEDYLEDSHFFLKQASSQKDSRIAKRYYRVSVFCAMSAIEAFVNYVGDGFAQSHSLELCEIALLTDRQFAHVKGKFAIVDKMEYHRLEDKLRFLFCRFNPNFKFEKAPSWSRLIEFKRFRDNLTHPRQDEDETELEKYKSMTEKGISSVIEIINQLCKTIFKKPLRKKLLDLRES